MYKTSRLRSSTALRTLGIVLLASGALVGCSETGTPVNHLESAREYQAEGNLEATFIELKSALQADPDNIEARRMMGMTALALEDPATATKELERAVELGLPPEQVMLPLARAKLKLGELEALTDAAERPLGELANSMKMLSDAQAAELFAIYGEAYALQERYDRAEQAYQQALERDPANPDGQLGLIALAAYQGDQQTALDSLNDLLEREPGFVRGWSYLGLLQRYRGDAESARAAYDRAIELGSRNPGDFLHRALVLISLGDGKGSEADLNYVASNFGDVIQVPLARGIRALRNDDLEQARDHFNAALAIDRNATAVVLFSGLTNAALGQDELAEEQLKRYLRGVGSGGGADIARIALARVLGRRGEYVAAEARLAEVLERDPGNAAALDLMSTLAMRQGDSAVATDWLRKSLSGTADSGQAFLKLGIGMLQSGDQAGAQAAMVEAESFEDTRDTAQAIRFRSLLAREQFDEALALAQQAVEAEPDNAWSRTLVGAAYIAAGETEAARAALERSLELAPGNLPASHNLALLDMADGDFEAARARYAAVLERDPDNADVPPLMARLEMRAGDPAAVMRWRERTVELRPEEITPRVLLARDYLRQGDLEAALDTLQPVSRRAQDNLLFLIHDGLVRLMLGQYATAAESYEKAVALSPELIPAQFGLARARAELGDVAGTEEALDAVIEVNPAFMPAQEARIRALILRKEFDAAAERIAALQERFGQAPQGPMLEGELLSAQGEMQAAVAAFEQAFERQPNSLYLLMLSEARRRADDVAGAAAQVTEWLESRPEDVGALQALAGYQMGLGESAAAVDTWRRLVELRPDNAAALNNLAWMLRKSDPAEAKGYAERALALVPGEPNFLDTLGVILSNQGELDGAAAALEEAYDALPSPIIGYHYAAVLADKGERARAVRVLERLLGDSQEFATRADAEALLAQLSR